MSMIGRLCDRIANGENREDLMNHEWERFRTFQNFPDVSVRAIPLAANGFYYTGQNDKVRCFSCSLEYSDWQEGDVPSAIHKRLSPTCEFVRETDGNNVPIRDRRPVSPTSSQLTIPFTPTGNNNLLMQHELEGQMGDFFHSFQAENIEIPKLKHPEFKNESKRMASFEKWTEESVNPDVIAQAGFFYEGFQDYVRCFYCGGGLRDWADGDDPWTEHAKWFPWCKFLLEQKGNQFIRTHSNNESENQLSERSKNKEDSEKGIPDGQLSGIAASQRAQEVCSNQSSADKVNEENGLLDADQRSLQNELMRLKQTYFCKICMDKEANVVFFPCSHMVACESCAPHIDICAICRESIKSRKKIFVA